MSLKLNKKLIFLGILAFLLIVNLLVIFNLNQFYLQAIFSFIFLITIPGLLIMLMLKIRKINPWEYFVYVIGLSIAFLIFAGLFINWTLPLFGIDKPLSLVPLLTSFDFFLLTFWLIAYKRNEKISLEIKSPNLDLTNRIFFIIPMIFPVLSILGALILNNNGPNYLTLIMLGGIAVYVFMVVLFRKKLNSNLYPWAIWMMCISLLLITSLRSWHISGWDISQEYQMFQLTKENFHWSMSNFRHAYNACLSVTILPTIFDSFLKINDEYIFKLLSPLIFSIFSIGICLFLKRYVQYIFAFIASFFFISQQWFISQMPNIAKQEISFLFFTLTLLVLFNKNITPMLKKTLFLIFGFSMVVSHYSTTYVALALFIFTYLICLVFRKTENKKFFSKTYEKLNLKEKKEKSKNRKHYLNGILIILLLIFSFLWLSQLTETSDNLIDFTHKTIKNMGKIFTGEMRSNRVEMALWSKWSLAQGYSTKEIDSYIKKITEDYQKDNKVTSFPNEVIQRTYKPSALPREYITHKGTKTTNLLRYLYIIDKYIIIFSIVFGVFYLLFFQFKKQRIDEEYIIMAFICVFLITVILFVPYVSKGYNFERLYQQSLVILSLPTVLGGLFVLKFFKKNIKIILLILIFLFYFLYNSGFMYIFIGGFPFLHLHNIGHEYSAHYTHKTEVKAILWGALNYDEDPLLYADPYSKLKIDAFGRLDKNIIITLVLPTIIDKTAYIYASYTNIVKGRGAIDDREYFNKGIVDYNFPTEFLNQNKNKIYNNGGSEIFK